jgi:transcriptional regulator with XRE-family HTH domain
MIAEDRRGDSSKIDALIGARVRALREHRRMSQTALGDYIGVTFQQVQKYERGKNRISASVLFKIAKAFEVHPADFFEGLQADQSEDDSWALASDPQAIDLMASFNEIQSAEIRTSIVNLVKSLVLRKSPNSP